MNILKKALALVVVSLASFASVANADSSIFAGPYVAIQGSAAGVEIDGEHNDPTMEDSKKNKGTTGMTGIFGSVQVGYNQPLSDMAFLTVGLTHTPTGDASFSAKDIANSKSVTMELSGINEVFVEPSAMVAENAAVFLHVGYSEAEMNTKGDDITNKNFDMEGTTVSAGLKLVTDGGIFIKAEAGMTEFEEINLTGITDENGGTTASAKGSPTIAFGTISLGMKF